MIHATRLRFLADALRHDEITTILISGVSNKEVNREAEALGFEITELSEYFMEQLPEAEFCEINKKILGVTTTDAVDETTAKLFDIHFDIAGKSSK